MKVTLIGLGVVVIAFALALWAGSSRHQSSLSELVESLIQAASPARAVAVNLEELDGLPVPVARYFRRVLRHGQPLVRVARFRQAGILRTELQSSRWLPFEAGQIVAPPATGFVWNARVDIAPLLHVRVRDALIAGQGSGQVSLLSAFTVAADGATPEMNSGALHRYLAEAVWYPTALLPSPKLKWTAIDNDKALATLTDNAVTVSLEFWFNGAGEITGIYTPGRWGSFGGGYKQVAWEGHFRSYAERSGMLIPMEGEVGWYSEGQWRAVWKGKITEMSYELAP